MAAPSSRTARVARLAAIVLMSSLALAATPGISNADNAPGGSIYFNESKFLTGEGTIGSAVLPGGEKVNDRLVTDGGDMQGQAGIAVDNGHIYWINAFSHTIGRSNLDGTGVNPNFITNVTEGCGLAVDGGHIYWGQSDVNTGAGMIGRANLDGTGVDPNFITGAAGPCGVAVDATHIYWANRQAVFFGLGVIGRANLDGTGVNQNFITPAPGTFPFACGVAVDGAHVYFAESHGTITRANLDGTGVDPNFITDGVVFPCGVAVDATHVYWANTTDLRTKTRDFGSTIGRANLDGTAVNPSWIASGSVDTPFGSVADHLFSGVAVLPTS
jgi:hypothetical protein